MSRRRQRVDTVVFDLGNVLIRWEPSWAFRSVLEPELVPAFLAEINFAAWNHAQDAGRPFAEGIAELTAAHPHHADAIAAYLPNFRATLEEMPESVAVLRELADHGARLLALTNWSAETFGIAREAFDFLDLFEGIVVSGEELVAKPEVRLFRVLLDRYRVDTRTALFVDDSPTNVATARELGMHGVVFTTVDAFRRELVDAGLLPAAT